MSKIHLNSNIVSVRWLQKHLNAENLIVCNATIPKVTSDASTANTLQIPKTRFFDIKKQFSDTNAPFPSTVPSAEAFEKAAQAIGVNEKSVIVVYDDLGIYSSARAWWLLKTFGFKKVAILNGGLPEWLDKGFKTEDKATALAIDQGNFKATYNAKNVVFFEDLEGISNDEAFKIIDARSSDRFNCLVAEPREGLRSGTIPNSVSLPYTQVLNGGVLKSALELKALFKALATPKQHLVFTCGSGITASILSLAATTAGYKNSIYDGSWTEYGTLKL